MSTDSDSVLLTPSPTAFGVPFDRNSDTTAYDYYWDDESLSLHPAYETSFGLIQSSEAEGLVGATQVPPAPLKRRPVDLPPLTPSGFSPYTRPSFPVPYKLRTAALVPPASYLQLQHRMPVLEPDQPAEEERSVPHTNSVGLGLVLCSSKVVSSSTPAASEPISRLRRLAPPPLVLEPLSSPVVGAQSPQLSPTSSVFDEPQFPVISSVRRQPDALTRVLTPISAAPTYLVFPEDARDTSVTLPDRTPWLSSVSREADMLDVPGSTRSAEGAIRENAIVVPLPKTADLGVVVPDNFLAMSSPAYRRDAAANESRIEFLEPPPLLRSHFLSLSPLSDMPNGHLLSPLHVDFRRLISLDDLILRAERCVEVMKHVKLSLCSCALLLNPEEIEKVCESLCVTLSSIQQILDDCPPRINLEDMGVRQRWFEKYRQSITSLERNMDLFYLFISQIARRPPRIHRLADYLDKLAAYQTKFSDLARRITFSHQRLRLMALRICLRNEIRTERTYAEQERMRRLEYRKTRQERYARRKEIRSEMRRVRELAELVRVGWSNSNEEIPAVAASLSTERWKC